MLQIWDGAFSNETAGALARVCDGLFRTDPDSMTFARARGPANELEFALDTFLTSIGDDSAVVEYWRRSRWAHVALHRDIDERLSRQGTYHMLLFCPSAGRGGATQR